RDRAAALDAACRRTRRRSRRPCAPGGPQRRHLLLRGARRLPAAHTLGVTDVVDRVLAALNGRDIDAFAACYPDDATIEDGYDEIVAAGRSGIRERYAVIFETFPKVRVTPLSRTDVG